MQFIIETGAFHFEAHVIEDLTYDVIIGRDFLQFNTSVQELILRMVFLLFF